MNELPCTPEQIAIVEDMKLSAALLEMARNIVIFDPRTEEE